jgi:hypothetical protein
MQRVLKGNFQVTHSQNFAKKKTLQGYFNINILGMYIYKMYQYGF